MSRSLGCEGHQIKPPWPAMIRRHVHVGRPTVLVIHDDGDVLDLLTRLFEGSGFDVIDAPTAFRAQAPPRGHSATIEVVVAPWDETHAIGGEVYRWVLQHRADLRTRFVFIADEVPPEFDAVVGGRCLAVPLSAPDELVRVARGIVRRVRTPPRGVPIVTRSTPTSAARRRRPAPARGDGGSAGRVRIRGDHRRERRASDLHPARAARLRRDRHSTGTCTTAAAPSLTAGSSRTSRTSRRASCSCRGRRSRHRPGRARPADVPQGPGLPGADRTLHGDRRSRSAGRAAEARSQRPRARNDSRREAVRTAAIQGPCEANTWGSLGIIPP